MTILKKIPKTATYTFLLKMKLMSFFKRKILFLFNQALYENEIKGPPHSF